MRLTRATPGDGFLIRLGAAVAALALAPTCSDDVGAGDQFGRLTVRVSVKPFGEEATAPFTVPPNAITGQSPDGFLNASISADGLLVAFESDSSTLTPSDANGLRDIFVKNRLTGAVENITNVIPGEFGPHPRACTEPAISGNGRYVAFVSTGLYITNPAGLGPASFRNIWVFDRVARTFAGASLLDPLAEPNNHCSAPVLSDDGRFVCWQTNATNVEADFDPVMFTVTTYTTAGLQVYVTDMTLARQNSPIRLLSHVDGAPLTGGNGASDTPRISADGAWVAFASNATNIDPPGPITDADTNNDVYVANVSTGLLELASIGFNPLTLANEKGDGSSTLPMLSRDGQFVYFVSGSSNWGLPTTLHTLVRRQRPAGPTTLVTDQIGSIASIIAVPDRISVSDDGQMTAFTRGGQVAVHNLASGAVTTVSVNVGGQTGEFKSWAPWISGDGRWVAWHTYASNLVPGDANGVNDVFVHGPLR